MNNGQVKPDTEVAEFDRLYAAENDEVTPPAQGQQNSEGVAAPTQVAATTPPASQGGEAAPETGGEGGGASTAQTGAADTDDWVASLPEEVRTRIAAERKAAEDRYNALHGRVAPTQRALSEANERLARLQTYQPQAQPPVQAPSQSADSYFDSPEWKQWAEDFPGDAKVVRASIEAQQRAQQGVIQQLAQQVQELSGRLGQTEHVASRTILNEEITKLESKHPDWQQLNQSDEFWGWFDSYRATVPKSVRSMYYDDAKLRECFNDAEFTIEILDRYKAATATAAPAAPIAQQQAPESTQSVQPVANPRLSMGVEPDVRGAAQVPRAVPLDSLTPEQQFDHIWKTTE